MYQIIIVRLAYYHNPTNALHSHHMTSCLIRSHEQYHIISSHLISFFIFIEEILGSEETVWCPFLGIKGQIDLVARARVRSTLPLSQPGKNKMLVYGQII